MRVGQPGVQEQNFAVFSTVDVNGTTVKFGDKGSVALPKGPPTVSWKSGATVEVKWGMRFNHGGGEQHARITKAMLAQRLCQGYQRPADPPPPPLPSVQAISTDCAASGRT